MKKMLSILFILFSVACFAQPRVFYGFLKQPSTTPPAPPSTNLFAWFDAAQSVTASGTDVTQWDDVSGNGHDATWSSNGKPQWNGTEMTFRSSTQDNLQVTGITSVPIPVEMWFVLKPNVTSVLVAHMRGSPYFAYINAAGFVITEANSNTADFPVSNGTYYLIHHIFNGATSLAQINDNSVSSADILSTADFTSMDFGNNPFGATDFTVKEIIIYQGGLADEAALRDYILTKYPGLY